MKERVGLRGFVRTARDQLPYWIERAPELPGLIHRVLDETAQGKRDYAVPQLEALREELRRNRRAARNRTFGVVLMVLALTPIFPLTLLEQVALLGAGLLLVIRD